MSDYNADHSIIIMSAEIITFLLVKKNLQKLSHTLHFNILKYDSSENHFCCLFTTVSLFVFCCSPGKENINEAKQRGADKTRSPEGNL